ncbi:MAG: DNA-binding protein [Microbacterium sp.]|nr:DNA-binding protein [Microbacterium sp.]
MGAPTVLRDDVTLVSHAVAELARRTHFPLAFGGLEHDGAVHVTTIVGARTRSIEGLVVRAERGLGGRALVERRPRMTLDYRTARSITHDYDRAILGEGIATLFAVPVLVRGSARGVLYCGSWAQAPVGELEARPAFDVAGELGTELRVREEVDRRLSTMPTSENGLSVGVREEIRESYAQLRSIAATVGDDDVRRRLEELEARLAALTGDAPSSHDDTDIHLSRREIDVLACAAVGSTNGEIAASLHLRETTVKSYLASAMAKLDASTRHAAVARARRAGLLP